MWVVIMAVYSESLWTFPETKAMFRGDLSQTRSFGESGLSQNWSSILTVQVNHCSVLKCLVSCINFCPLYGIAGCPHFRGWTVQLLMGNAIHACAKHPLKWGVCIPEVWISEVPLYRKSDGVLCFITDAYTLRTIHTMYIHTYDERMPSALCLGTPVLRQKPARPSNILIHLRALLETILSQLAIL